MKPPRNEPGLDETRMSRGPVRAGDAAARPIASARQGERVDRSGSAVRDAAARVTQLLLTPDAGLDALRGSRRFPMSTEDLGRVRAMIDRLHDAIVGDAVASHDLVERAWQVLGDDATGAAPARPMRRTPSVEVISLPPTSSRDDSVGAATPADDARVVPADPSQLARPWAMIGEEETAHAPTSEAAITRFVRPAAPASPQLDATQRLRPVTPVELTLDQHAALCAECDLFPDHRAQIQAKYGISDLATRERVDRTWSARLQADATLRKRWHERYQACRAAFARR